MVPIKENLVPKDKYAIKCPYTRTPTRVVIHNTANDAPAANEISYMRYNDLEISFHYAVDDVNIVQGIPENRNAWASGDGHGKGNMEGIHIEICYSKSGGEKFDKAEQNAAEFTASLLKKYGWGIDKVTKHRDYDGKYCPHRTLDRGWQRFLSMVKRYMEPAKTPVASKFTPYLIRKNCRDALN
ncbi:N-acetylmuramoyl-L-alanine amidase family protein, partial [Hominenteromicrobium sp.]